MKSKSSRFSVLPRLAAAADENVFAIENPFDWFDYAHHGSLRSLKAGKENPSFQAGVCG
jgi:hypothetical protein